jgi:3-methyladenine DNA glycosylase AlkD
MLGRVCAASTSYPVASVLLPRLQEAYRAAADPRQAGPMRAYMRDQFPFLGIKAPLQDAVARRVVAGVPRPTESDLTAVARGCWELPEREYQYFACWYLRRHQASCSSLFVDTARHLVTTKSWWDTVDTLAAHVVGPLVLRDPALVSTMDEWLAGEDLWLTRTAILHQLGYKQHTDAQRLFRYCAARADHPDFFIRKAIGWALRQYAKTAPEQVRDFVARTPLSGLSRREALKNLLVQPAG